MPELPGRLEQFSRLLAAGMLPTPAARAAGFTDATADAKARRMAVRADVAQRVNEMRATMPPPPPPPQPTTPAHQHAVQAPAPQAPIPQAPAPALYEPPHPLPRIDISRASREEVRHWSMTVLAELVHEAHNARDRRVVTSAMAEISKLSGTYAPQRMEAVHVSVLDGMSGAELRALLQFFNELEKHGPEALLIEAEDVTEPEPEMEDAECDPLS